MSTYVPATVGMSLSEVDTPALLLDLDAFERNLDRLNASLAGTNVKVRPHAKSHKCPHIALAPLARQAHVAVCVDDAGNVQALDAAAGAEFGVRLDVLVEVNVGANRCGVEPGEPAVRLAQKIAACRNLRFAGLQAYHGSAQHVRKVEARRT